MTILEKSTAAVAATVLLACAASRAAAAPTGLIETPPSASTQSGIGLISGWHCSGRVIEIQIDGGERFPAGSHTPREDTRAACGRADTGFGLVFNFNLLAPGTHRLTAYADGAIFAAEGFTTTSFGVEYLRGKSAQYALPNFPDVGQQAVVAWSEEQQNFAVVGVEPAPDVSGTYYGATITHACDPDRSARVRFATYTVTLDGTRVTLAVQYADGSTSRFTDLPASLSPEGFVVARAGGDFTFGVDGRTLQGSSLDTPCGLEVHAAKGS
jgi:hypothetical protein